MNSWLRDSVADLIAETAFAENFAASGINFWRAQAKKKAETAFASKIKIKIKIDGEATHLARRSRRWLFAFAGAARAFFNITAIAQRGASASRPRALQQQTPQAEVRKREGRAIASHVAVACCLSCSLHWTSSSSLRNTFLCRVFIGYAKQKFHSTADVFMFALSWLLTPFIHHWLFLNSCFFALKLPWQRST